MVVLKALKLTFVSALVAFGKYFWNRSRPSESTTSSRGIVGSLEVSKSIIEESMDKKLPFGLERLNSSAKNRGLVLSMESQHGIRNATGLFPGICFRRSRQP